MKIFEEVKNSKCRLLSFISNCGGLPSPEAVDNPLGYKFSWNPMGVLLASQNPARFLNDLLQGEKLKERLSKTLNRDQIQTVLNSFNWLGIFDSNKEIQIAESPIHVLCSLLEEKLSY